MPGNEWDIHYKTGTPPWETGSPSAELARVIMQQLIAPGRVLELGCGSGINAVWLAQQGFEVTAVDFNALAIAKARARAAAAKVKVHFEQADVLDLPDLGPAFPFFFDRGCFHSVRHLDGGANRYVKNLQQATAAGATGLILTGNAKEKQDPGPPVVSEADLRAELEPTFKIVQLREFRFDVPYGSSGPLAWSCLLRRAGA